MHVNVQFAAAARSRVPPPALAGSHSSSAMSRAPSVRDRLQGGRQAPVQHDKFVGLVEKRPGAESDSSIRSSSLDAPFGHQSNRPAAAARSGFGGVVASGNKSLDRIFVHARRTGILTLENMSLTAVPPQVCALYDEKSITAEEKFWECVDLTTLNLQHNQIAELPSGITNLMHLQVVLLAHNQLRALPDEFLSLQLLKKVDLSHNQLTVLPNGIDALQSLVELNVSHNQLRSLPESLCDLGNLEVLTADHNALEWLPRDIGHLRQLLRVQVSANKLTGLPESMSYLSRLATLEAKQNRLQSDESRSARGPPTGVPSLRGLKDLTLLDLSENQLSRIPELPASSKLAQVFVGFNALTQCDALVNCIGLVSVDLHNNRLESLPVGLGRRDSSLKFLDCSNNELSDIPGELGLIAALNKLLVDGNPLRKFPRGKLQGGSSMAAFKKYLVTRIDASRLVEIGGEEAEELVGNSGLVHSNNPSVEFAIREGASSNTINLAKIAPPLDEFPTAIFAHAAIADLHTLDISNQRIPESSVPNQLSICKRLRVMRANNLGWKTLPLAICTLLQLEELTLSSNGLTDLPTNLRALQSLTRIDLSQNAFGAFPSALGGLAGTLTHITLANNRLTSLPDDFCARFGSSLQSLDLSTNRLTNLPEGWRWVNARFEYLNLENNQLAALPLELGLVSGLRTLMLHGNPQRTVLYAVLAKGTPAILATLKMKIPAGSDLLDPNATRPRLHADEEEEPREASERGRYAQEESRGNRAFGSRPAATVDEQFSYPATRSVARSAPRYEDEPPRDRDAYSRSRTRDPYAAPSARGGYDQDCDRRDARDYRDDNRYDREDARDFVQRSSAPRTGYEYEPRTSPTPAYGRRASPPAAPTSSYRPEQDDDRYRDARSFASASSSTSSYAQDRRRDDRATYDRDDRASIVRPAYRREDEYDDRDHRQGSYRGNAAASFDSYAPAAGRTPAFAAPTSAYGNPAASSSGADVTALQSSIARLTSELEDNLSLGSLQKMKIRKDLAGMKAELNRITR